jgi:hypothetical protein
MTKEGQIGAASMASIYAERKRFFIAIPLDMHRDQTAETVSSLQLARPRQEQAASADSIIPLNFTMNRISPAHGLC